MTEKIRSFKDLRVWQKGIELVKYVYKLTAKFPKEEMWGISMQMRRASVSVPSNIAEGFRRMHPKEHRQFLNVVLGSCAELETLTIIAHELSFIDEAEKVGLSELLDHICGMAVNMIKKV